LARGARVDDRVDVPVGTAGVDQSVPGYCVLACTTHVREPYALDRAGRIAFLEDGAGAWERA
jgi:hypothetical protein